jgi:hypothetical protein
MEEILLMALFFAPAVLASRGIGGKRTWFRLSRTFFFLFLVSLAGDLAALRWMLDSFGRPEVVKLLSAGMVLTGLLFLSCLLAGFFYREKEKAPGKERSKGGE